MINIKDLSIERKLIAMQLLTTFIVLLFFGMLLFFNDLHVLRKSVISRLTSIAQLIGANSISALNFLDNETAGEILSSLQAEDDIVNAWIYDADGNLFATFSKHGYSDFTFPRIAVEDYEFDIDYTTVTKNIFQNDDIIGMISLRLSMEQSRVIVNRKVWITFLVLIIGMIIALILSHITQRTISRPVFNLVNNSKNISETGNYSIRVEKEGNDEIGILCDTFNDMMKQIEKRERERDSVEGALRESEQKFRTLTSNIPGAVYRCANDPDWTMDFISDVIEEVSGYKASDFIQNRVRSFASIIHPDDREMVEATVHEAISERVPYIIEYRIIRSDESIRWVYEKGQGIFSDDGILLWLDGAIYDVTERKFVEEELKRTHTIYRKTIENSRGVPYQLSFDDNKFKFIGEGWEEIFGIPAQDFTFDQWNKITKETIIADTEAPTDKLVKYRAAFSNGEIERYRADLRIVTSNGDEKWVNDCSLPIRDDKSGKVIGSLGILQDITERKRVEEELEKHKEHLEELVETRTIELINTNKQLQQEITERNKAEEALRESERKFKNLYNNAQVGLFRANLSDGKFIECNERMAGLLGYETKEECINTCIASEHYVDPKTRERMKTRIERNGKVDNFEALVKQKDGTHIWLMYSTTIYPEEGHHEGVAIDITDRKQAEEARRENEEKFESIGASAQDAIIIMDNTGKISYWNDAATKSFGYAQEEAIGQLLHELLAPKRYHKVYKKAFSKFQETGQGDVIGKTTELFGIRKDGEEFPFELSLSSVKIKNKWNAIGILRDITERKQAELALKESEASLANAQRIAHLGNWDWNIEKNELRWSDEIFRIFGLSPKEFGATYNAFLNSVHPEDRELVKKSVNEALNKKTPYGIDHRIVQPDGTELIVHEQAEAFFDDTGKPIRMSGTVQDITDRKKAEKALKETQAQLVQSEKMASLGTLVAGVAHEINTPVGAISSMYDTQVRAVDRLKATLNTISTGDTEEHQKVDELFKIIEDANRVIASGTDRVTNIVRRLKSFARLDEAELQTVDIHEGLEDTLIIVHHELKHKAVVDLNFGDIPPISCYPRQLNQVYLNLLVNAIQAIEDKGTITITTFKKKNHVHIQFKDTGIGIPAKVLNKIFDPGYTTKGVGVGTGLGLSICYQIVKDHHGDILVESKVGKGTAFTIILPMTPIA